MKIAIAALLAGQTVLHLGTGKAPGAVSIFDADGDQRADLAVANGGGDSVSVFRGDGAGGFTEVRGSPFEAGKHPNDLAPGTGTSISPWRAGKSIRWRSCSATGAEISPRPGSYFPWEKCLITGCVPRTSIETESPIS